MPVFERVHNWQYSARGGEGVRSVVLEQVKPWSISKRCRMPHEQNAAYLDTFRSLPVLFHVYPSALLARGLLFFEACRNPRL